MSTPYVGADVFPSSILCPDDGENRTAAAQNIPDQGLADRTAWLAARRTEDQASFALDKARLDATPALNFTVGNAQAFIHAAWNPRNNAWYGIETASNCKASFTGGWTWGANVITGADTLQRIASDAAGNMVLATSATDSGAHGCGVIHEFTASTSTWTRRHNAMGTGSNNALVGRVNVVFEPVSGLWCLASNYNTTEVSIGTSSDRITWTNRAITFPAVLSVTAPRLGVELAAGGGRLVMVGRNAPSGVQDGQEYVWTSIDGGVTWVTQAKLNHGITTGSSDSIAYSAASGLFMLVIGNGSTACKVYTSPDGVAWTARATFATTRCIVRTVALGPIWVAVQSQGSVLYSFDSGVTWRHAGFQVDTPTGIVASPGQLLGLCSSTVFPGFTVGNAFDLAT